MGEVSITNSFPFIFAIPILSSDIVFEKEQQNQLCGHYDPTHNQIPK